MSTIKTLITKLYYEHGLPTISEQILGVINHTGEKFMVVLTKGSESETHERLSGDDTSVKITQNYTPRPSTLGYPGTVQSGDLLR